MDSFDDQQMFSPKNSESKNNRSLDQPDTHKKNKSCTESLLCCQTFDNDLSQSQLKLFYLMKSFANILYEDSNSSHQKNLKDLYQIAFEQDLNSQDLSSDQWMSLGFQNKSAQTDFRGAGLIGLNNLIIFAKKQKKIMQEMCFQSNEFLWAMTSLNITYFLKIFFHLADFLNYKKDKKAICSRKSLKNFTLLLESGVRANSGKELLVLEECLKDIFYEIHEILLIYCFKQWLNFREKTKKEASLMDFYHIFEAMKAKIREFFEEEGHCTLILLREYLESVLKHLK